LEVVRPTAPYPNDSLRWVAAEVRHPPIDEFATSIPTAFRDHIRDQFPIPEEQTQLSVSVGPAGPSAQQVLQHRFVRRDRLMSVTVGRDAVTLETTEYAGWTSFSGLLVDVLRALEEGRRPDGIVRVGLRYIDEIRLPEPPENFQDWSGWLDDRLVAPFMLNNELQLANGTVLLQYGEPPGYVTVFRAAPFAAGRTVQLGGALRMPVKTPDGPYFLLDTDASWADPDGQIPEFASGRLAEILNDLHKTCSRLFEVSITDRLREAVLSRPREEVWGR
jgi:uncharacterized protein (TIGR04255 family)